MKLGKRERALRKERMRWLDQCRQRHDAVLHPGIDEAAASLENKPGNLASFWPSQKAKPRVPAGWNSTVARSLAQGKATVIS